MEKCYFSWFIFNFYFQFTKSKKFQIIGKNEELQWVTKFKIDFKPKKYLLPSVQKAGIIAVEISGKVNPELTAQEQAFFIAGFQECIKWLNSNR